MQKTNDCNQLYTLDQLFTFGLVTIRLIIHVTTPFEYNLFEFVELFNGKFEFNPNKFDFVYLQNY